MAKYKELAEKVGALVDEKNTAYGNSFDQAGEFLRLLYPNGIPPEKYTDMLCIIRIFDKLKRIATKKDAFGESPYQDIVGYGLLGLEKDHRAQTKAETLSKLIEQTESISDTDVEELSSEESEVGSEEEPTFLKLEPGQPTVLQNSSSKEANGETVTTVPVHCIICKNFVANVPADFAEKQNLFAHEECYEKSKKIS